MTQDTGKFRKNTKDQYYTKLSVAAACVATIRRLCPETDEYQWVEPSAGKGAFIKALSEIADVLGMDLEPGDSSILGGDFLKWQPATQKKRIFFGNPPFGPQSSLAKAFIRHAAQHGDIIAFILPRSFVKPSMNRVFPLAFHCEYSQELEKGAFEVNGSEYDVPCVFQIWRKKTTNRVIEPPIDPVGFVYVKHGSAYDLAIKRAGGHAGKCSVGDNPNPNYHYFLKLESKHLGNLLAIIEKLNQHTFPSNTVGPRSLSKSEVNYVLNRIVVDYTIC